MSNEQQADMVNHPPHYIGNTNGVECIQVARYMPFALGNAFKYVWRAGLKGGAGKTVEDLEKALWYLNDYQVNEFGWHGTICNDHCVRKDTLLMHAAQKMEDWRKNILQEINGNNLSKAVNFIELYITELERKNENR